MINIIKTKCRLYINTALIINKDIRNSKFKLLKNEELFNEVCLYETKAKERITLFWKYLISGDDEKETPNLEKVAESLNNKNVETPIS